jgi:hypothetical protein
MNSRLLTLITIIFSVLRLSGQDIDPRDYIGEDISRYPYHLRNKIERAFLSETGERFTGSQYDPRSPNYAFERRKRKTTISDIDETLDCDPYEGGFTLAERITQSVLSQTPGTGVTGQTPRWIQRGIDDENRERKEREINLKIKEAQLKQLERYNNENRLSNTVAGDSRVPFNLADINDFQLHLEKAYAGDKESQFKIGSMYEFGKGTGKNQAKAIEWYKKAALQGHAMAQTIVGYVRPVEVSKPPVAPKSSVSTGSPKPIFNPTPTPTPTPHAAITPEANSNETASTGIKEAMADAISRLKGFLGFSSDSSPSSTIQATVTPSQAATTHQTPSTSQVVLPQTSENFILRTDTYLEIRKEPTMESKIIAKIPESSYIISIKKDYTGQNGSEWSLITLGPHEGWVPKRFLSKITKYQK